MAADVYSYGIVLHESYTTMEPFSMYNFRQPWHLARHVTNGGRMPIPESCPELLADLIKRCWDADPKLRPPFEECMRTMETVYRSLSQSSEGSSSQISLPMLPQTSVDSTPSGSITLGSFLAAQQQAQLRIQAEEVPFHTIPFLQERQPVVPAGTVP